MEEEKNILETAKTNTEELSGFIGLMEKMSDFIKNHGLKGTFTSLLTLFIASVMAYFIFNPNAFFEKFQNFTQEKHEQGIKQRLEADPVIRNTLIEFRGELGADRAYILEAHNGGTNLTNLPFLYADLTYIEPKNHYGYIEKDYKDFRLSRYPWASFIIQHGFWFGSVEDCKESDPELFYRLTKEEVSYMGVYVIHGNTGLPSACLGIIFTEGQEIPDKDEIFKTMQKYTGVITPYLISE